MTIAIAEERPDRGRDASMDQFKLAHVLAKLVT
jgi:hypothetical protein